MGTPVDGEGWWRPSALVAVVRSGSQTTVEILLETGANANHKLIPWAIATDRSHHSLVQILLDAGVGISVGSTVLHAAVERGRSSIVEMLIKAGGDMGPLSFTHESIMPKAIRYRVLFHH